MRPATNPFDNASCESFMKTLKREEVCENKHNSSSECRGRAFSTAKDYKVADETSLRIRSSLVPTEHLETRTGSNPAIAAFCHLVFFHFLQTKEIWRKRVGVEPTIRPAKDRIAGFEGREGHRTNFASGMSISGRSGMEKLRGSRAEVRSESTAPSGLRVNKSADPTSQERTVSVAACLVRSRAATSS
jgi:hypothetical protein